MSRTDLERFAAACDYPGPLDEDLVERHLAAYLQALGTKRTVVRLRSGWWLQDHPALQRNVNAILDNFARRNPAALDALDALDARAARDALDARAARDARAALDALDARDALSTALTNLQRFAAWCMHRGWWYWAWDLSWIACTYPGAKQLKKEKVEAWSRPLFEAFVAGCWSLYWTDDTLYWFAKPVVHRDPTPGTRRLHNDKYAALESDIENLYFWRGVLVPAFVIVRPDWITLAHIDGESNAEVRRIMVERYKSGDEVKGAAAYIRDAGGKRLDHDERFGTLWHREVAGDEPIVMLEVINSTREPSGEFKRYWLRVPPQMRSAHEAVAWTFDRPAAEYAPQIET